jgi:hypothetical protein
VFYKKPDPLEGVVIENGVGKFIEKNGTVYVAVNDGGKYYVAKFNTAGLFSEKYNVTFTRE